ncbi:hypothetical protein R4Y45_01615 [Holzapfeliella sp. He02]|uniref:DUF5640 domain-containing protein n=1 Tax=Holzapfeliella saturejae TaxID=3082953 RepID=A0ABU8SGW9_9LACO
MRQFSQSKKIVLAVFAVVTILAGLVFFLLANSSRNHEKEVAMMSQEIVSESQFSAINTSSSSTSMLEARHHSLVGNWSGSNLSFSFKTNGTYTYQNTDYTASGSYLVAGEYDDIILLKLSYFRQNAGDTYLYLRFNDGDTKVSIDNLGTFSRATDVSPVNPGFYMTNSLKSAPQYASESLIGTWTRISNDGQTIDYVNYNPDGSFEEFNSQMVKIKSGQFSVNTQGKTITVLEDFDDNSPGIKIPYSTNSNFTILTSLANDQPNTVSYKNSLPDKLT